MVSAVNKHRHGNGKGSGGRHTVNGANVQQSVFGALYMSATTVLLGDNLPCVFVRVDGSKQTGGQLTPRFTTATVSKAGRQRIVRTRRSQQAAFAKRHSRSYTGDGVGPHPLSQPCDPNPRVVAPHAMCCCVHAVYTQRKNVAATNNARHKSLHYYCCCEWKERVQHARVDENDALPHRPELGTSARIQRRMTASQRWREASPGRARPPQVLAPTSFCESTDTIHTTRRMQKGWDGTTDGWQP